MSIKNIEIPCTNYTFLLTPVESGYKVTARSTRYCSIGRAKKELGIFKPTASSLEEQMMQFKAKYGLTQKSKAIVIYELSPLEKTDGKF